MPKYGIIDLGSNTIRLSVFDVADTGKPEKSGKGEKSSKADKTEKNAKTDKNTKSDKYSTREDAPKFREIVDEKQIVGLSSYIEGGNLSDAGIQKAADVLARHLETARNVGCKSSHIFATAVIRNCKNKSRVVKRIEREIGHSIDVVSGKDEAHLGFVGASYSHVISEGILIDIGGGSSEVTRVHKKHGIFSVSLPEGCVSAYASYVKMIFPTKKECEKISSTFGKIITAQSDFPKAPSVSPEMFGIGGSVRAMAKMYARMKGAKTPSKLKLSEMDEILKLLADKPAEFAHVAVKAVPDRLHTLVPGTLIARQLMQHFDAKTLSICKYGVREGYLLTRVL